MTVSGKGFVCLRSQLTFKDAPVGLPKDFLPLLIHLALPMLLNYYIYYNTDTSVLHLPYNE